jgi:hypothetical protein
MTLSFFFVSCLIGVGFLPAYWWDLGWRMRMVVDGERLMEMLGALLLW